MYSGEFPLVSYRRRRVSGCARVSGSVLSSMARVHDDYGFGTAFCTSVLSCIISVL